MTAASDVESGSVVAESQTTGSRVETGSDSVTGSDVTGSSLPLVLASAYQDQKQREQVQTLQKLPSHRFRYSVWHDLTLTEVKGHQLKAPRIRNGPPEKEKYFYRVRDENNMRIHHTRKGRERKDYRDKMEEWEVAEIVNLSYQELGHGYQKDNFVRVLRRLIRVEDLNLIHNELTDLNSVHFPRCWHLNLNNNYLTSFTKLPKMPAIKFLTIDNNVIEDIEGLHSLAKTPLESLSLRGNPVCFSLNYRQKVFHALPNLKVLDDVAKLPEDSVFDADDDQSKSCTIS